MKKRGSKWGDHPQSVTPNVFFCLIHRESWEREGRTVSVVSKVPNSPFAGGLDYHFSVVPSGVTQSDRHAQI